MNTPYGLEIVDKLQLDQPPNHLSSGSNVVRRRAAPAGRLPFVLGQGQALHQFARRQGAHPEDGRSWRNAGAERSHFGGGVRIDGGDGHAMSGELRGARAASRPAAALWRGEAGLRSAQALSREFQSAYRDIHDLILARSSAGKLAKLLLSWTPPSSKWHQRNPGQLRPDSRRNGADDRCIARDGDAPAQRSTKEPVDSSGGFYSGDS
jgi:hypothetical protein